MALRISIPSPEASHFVIADDGTEVLPICRLVINTSDGQSTAFSWPAI